MIRTERKPLAEIVKAVEGDGTIFVLHCGGCPEGAETSTPQILDETVKALADAGHEVLGPVMVDFLCHKALILSRLQAPTDYEKWKRADRVLVFSCGLGVQAVATALAKPVMAALNTQDLGGLRGKFPSAERCRECGDCVLHLTGGICPIAMCSKSLVNGTCGGTNDGKCEVSPEKDCGWYLIYKRLQSLGRLADYAKPIPARDYSKGDIPDALRRTIWWGLETPETEEPAGGEKTAKVE